MSGIKDDKKIELPNDNTAAARKEADLYLCDTFISNDACEHKPCVWLLTETFPAQRENIQIIFRGIPTPLSQMGQAGEEIVRAILAKVQLEHRPGVVRELIDGCEEGCDCWQVEPDPEDDDWGPRKQIYVSKNVKFSTSGSSGPTHKYYAIGHVEKRKVIARGRCDSANGIPLG